MRREKQLLNPKLRALAHEIQNKKIQEKVIELMENLTFKIDRKNYASLPIDSSPAGLSHHHCYPGGYIEHVVSTTEIALALCTSVKKVYHGKVDRDLVVAGAILHDAFKPLTYAVNADGSYRSTSLADNLDHTSLAIAELIRRGFPLKLVHIVAAHHGQYGPIRPRTLEALIVHLADLADSRLNGEVLYAASYLTRRAVGEELEGLDSKEAFEIVHSKSVEGWEGVTRATKKIVEKRKARKT